MHKRVHFRTVVIAIGTSMNPKQLGDQTWLALWKLVKATLSLTNRFVVVDLELGPIRHSQLHRTNHTSVDGFTGIV